jgi:hypothetical protein
VKKPNFQVKSWLLPFTAPRLAIFGVLPLFHANQEVAKDTVELHGLVSDLQSGGLSRVAIYDLFESFMHALREEARQADEAAVGDALDFMSGWCSPALVRSADQPGGAESIPTGKARLSRRRLDRPIDATTAGTKGRRRTKRSRRSWKSPERMSAMREGL